MLEQSGGKMQQLCFNCDKLCQFLVRSSALDLAPPRLRVKLQAGTHEVTMLYRHVVRYTYRSASELAQLNYVAGHNRAHPDCTAHSDRIAQNRRFI